MTPSDIKRRRLAYPLSRAELGSRLGVAEPTVQAWETGERTPRAARMADLGALFAKREGCVCACHGTRALNRAGIPLWNDDESKALASLIRDGHDPDTVADQLCEQFGYRRTRGAISDRATRLGLTFMQGYSATRIGIMLGVSKNRARSWIASGLIPAERHIGVESGRPSRWLHVCPPDLEAFVVEHAGVLVDVGAIRDPLLRKKAEAGVAGAQDRRRAV